MTSIFSSLTLVGTQPDRAAKAATPEMEPFDLSRAIQGAPLCTREGLPAILMRVDETAPPAFRLKVKLPQYSYPRSFCDNGKFREDGAEDEFDLFMVCQQTNASEQPAVGIAA